MASCGKDKVDRKQTDPNFSFPRLGRARQQQLAQHLVNIKLEAKETQNRLCTNHQAHALQPLIATSEHSLDLSH